MTILRLDLAGARRRVAGEPAPVDAGECVPADALRCAFSFRSSAFSSSMRRKRCAISSTHGGAAIAARPSLVGGMCCSRGERCNLGNHKRDGQSSQKQMGARGGCGGSQVRKYLCAGVSVIAMGSRSLTRVSLC